MQFRIIKINDKFSKHPSTVCWEKAEETGQNFLGTILAISGMVAGNFLFRSEFINLRWDAAKFTLSTKEARNHILRDFSLVAIVKSQDGNE